MLKDGETTEFENRTYVDPNVALNESLGFIDNLKAVQAQNNQQIKDQTYNLGTSVPSQMGGLLGADSYFTSRYQTPQTVALVNDLRATAQAQALNDALKSEQSKWRNRYNVAYRNTRRRARNSGGGGGGGLLPDDQAEDKLKINTKPSTGGDKITINENPNTGTNDLIQIDDLTYSLGGVELIPAPTSFMALSNQGMSLGVWPDGSRMTEGSTYTTGGKTYTYVKAGNTRTPNVYQVRR